MIKVDFPVYNSCDELGMKFHYNVLVGVSRSSYIYNVAMDITNSN